MDFDTHIAIHNRYNKCGVHEYIKDVILKDNHILFYNKDLKEWMVQDRQTGRRRYLVIILRYEDFCIDLLLCNIPHTSPLFKILHEIEHNEFNNAWKPDNRCKHIGEWNHYLNMVGMDVYNRQITQILQHKDLPQIIIDKKLALQQPVLDYIEKNKTNDFDKNRIEIDTINVRLCEIVKNICSLTHYIIVADQ